MRVVRSLILLLGVTVAATGCAEREVTYMAYPSAPMGIDNVVYGVAGAPEAAPPSPGLYMAAPYAPAPYAAAPYPAAPYGYAPAAMEPRYTLDSGDRLRIVVFGQEGLTNSYLVSAGGSIDMPLIGPVAGAAPPLTNWRRVFPKGCATASSASRMWPSRSRATGRSLFSAKSPARPISLRRQHDSGDGGGDRRRIYASGVHAKPSS